MTLDYGNYGIVLIMGNAGFMSSTVLQNITYHTSHSFGHFRELLHCETLNPRHLNPRPYLRGIAEVASFLLYPNSKRELDQQAFRLQCYILNAQRHTIDG